MATRKVIRGDSDSFKVTFVARACNKGKQTTTPIDITGWEIRFTVRTSVPSTSVHNDKDAIIHKVADIIDAKNGVAYFTITGDDTDINPGEYWYDIQYVKPQNCMGVNEIKSLPRGKYIVLGDITRNSSLY